jgi:hypothetical protein
VYEWDSERSATAKGIRTVNTLRALSYFLVAGVQIVYCSTEVSSCRPMIVLVPLSLGLVDSLLIWQSGKDTLRIKILALLMCVISLTVAINTLVPILYGGALTAHTQVMLILSLVVIIVSIVEFVIVAYDLASSNQDSENIVFSTSIRSYRNPYGAPL